MKAFTLLELLIVMAISAVLFGIAIWGTGIFRAAVQLESAAGDLISNLRSAQNLARNSAVDFTSLAQLKAGQDVDVTNFTGFSIWFDTNDYSMRICTKASGDSVDCTVVYEPNLKASEYSQVSIEPQGLLCQGVVFRRLTGNISGLGGQIDEPTDTGVCDILLTQLTTGSQKTIRIDLDENAISD